MVDGIKHQVTYPSPGWTKVVVCCKCVHHRDSELCIALQEFNTQIAQIESDFKVTTKTAQSLVKDSSQEVVNEMLQTLNTQKEVIVKLRKEIPERIKYLKVKTNWKACRVVGGRIVSVQSAGGRLLTTKPIL